MASKTLLLAVLLTAISATTTTMAQEPATPACTTPVTPPAELSGWSLRSPLAAAASLAGLASATIAPGAAIDATLQPTPAMQYPMRPEKPGGSVSYGGLFGFTVPKAGTYRIALDSGAWLDVLADGKPVASSAHGHGPDCSGIRKMVDFPLAAGPHVLQIAANGKPSLVVLVTRLP